jgi:hypothetical protein
MNPFSPVNTNSDKYSLTGKKEYMYFTCSKCFFKVTSHSLVDPLCYNGMRSCVNGSSFSCCSHLSEMYIRFIFKSHWDLLPSFSHEIHSHSPESLARRPGSMGPNRPCPATLHNSPISIETGGAEARKGFISVWPPWERTGD